MRSALLVFALLTACDAAGDSVDDNLLDDEDADVTPPAADPDMVARVVSDGTCKNDFDFDKEFLIRDLAVVEDPDRTTGNGVWTFGHLLSSLSVDGEQFLSNWRESPTLNGQIVRGNASKVDDLLITPWRKSDFAPNKAPFRLLAIVLRPEAPGGAELRLIYGAVSAAGSALPMTVAFEYAITPAFMIRWHDMLSPLARGSAAYRTALATLTEQGIANLKQVRTNETVIEPPWDLREFHLSGHQLVPARLEGVPKINLDGDPSLRGGVTPGMETFQATIPEKTFTWSVPNRSKAERFAFSIGTCNGCHSFDTRTQFTHVEPREAGEKARISLFLQSRICSGDDQNCRDHDRDHDFNAPKLPAHRFQTQDDRMHALNLVLAAANDCQP